MVVQPDYCDDISFDSLNDIQVSTSHSVYDNLLSTNNLKRVMTEQNSYYWSDYEADIIKAALPWIAFSIFAFLFLIIAIVIRFLRCMCCKQQIKEKGRCIKLTCVIFSFLITILSLLACSFIIYYSDQTFQSIQQVQCAAGKFPYVLKNGDLTQGWGGLDILKQCTTNISQVFNTTFNTSTSQLWTGTNWLEQSNFQNSLQNYYQKYFQANVTSSYPYQDNSIPTAYTLNLGPLNDSKTGTGLIFQEYLLKIAPIVLEIEEIKQVTQSFQQNLNTTLNFAQNLDVEIGQYKNGTDQIKQNIDNWIINYMDQIRSSWRGFTFWVVVWGWFICIGALITVYSQAMSKPSIAHGLCCFWLFAGIVAMIGFLASAGTLAVGLVTRDSCGVIDDLFTTSGMYNYDLIIPTQIVPLTETCILGNGNLVPVLNLQTFLWAFQNISEDYTLLGQLNVTQALANFTSIQFNFAQISSPINYSAVTPPTPIINQNDQVDFNLNQLNMLTSNLTSGTHQSTCSQKFSDFWVLNTSNCGIYTYTPPTSPEVNFGLRTCLLMTEWGSLNVSKRYENVTCTYSTVLGDYSQSIYQYISSIQSFVDSVNYLYANMAADLTQVNNTLTGLVTQIVSLYGNLGTYLQSPQQILYLMQATVGSSGLVSTLNCSLISSYKAQIKISMCDNSLENIYEVFIFVFVLSFLMLLLELVNLYLSRALLKGIEIY